MRLAYLIRYGVARSVARFAVATDVPADSLGAEPLERGQVVVVRTHRGTELGEVLGVAPASFDADDPGGRIAPLLRVASSADLIQAHRAEMRRAADYDACQAVFRAGIWPLELIDAEPLLDEGRTVLHYLGPHRLDAAGLVAVFRDRCGLDIVLEPVGRDIADDDLEAATEGVAEAEPEPADHGCGSCGSSGGGCGSCGSAGAGCAVKALVGQRRERRSHG